MFENYNFSTDYQDLILACIVKHPEKFMKYAGTLNSAYFTGAERMIAARALFAYWKKAGRFPVKEAFEQLVYDAIVRTTDQKDEEKIIGYARKLDSLDTKDVDDVAAHTLAFAKERALYIAFDKGFKFYQEGKQPPGGYSGLFDEATKVGMNIEDLGYIIRPGSPDIERIIKAYNSVEAGVPTGFAPLDAVWRSGWRAGWLIVVLAPPKRYKTTFLVNLALNMVGTSIKRPVLYYPCEITQVDAAIRVLQCVTDRSKDFIEDHADAFTKLAYEEVGLRVSQPLIIKGFPLKGATISGDIRSHALMVKQQLGIIPKAIMIDHAETVKSGADVKYTSDHRAQSDIYAQAKALALEMECPVIMPDRCNKETVGLAVPSMKSFQGAFEKAGIVDGAIGLCGDEEEYYNNIIRYFIFLNRHGEANQHFKGRVFPKTMKMTVDEAIPWTPEEDDKEQNGFRRREKKARASLIEMQSDT